MSADSEDEKTKKSTLYKEIYDSKLFLKAYNRNKYGFDLRFPKSSFDKIIELYGKEKLRPLSFVMFSNPFEISETIRYSSRNINVRTSVQINSILDVLDNYYVYPISYDNLDELEKIKKAPKLKPKYLKNIARKMGLTFSEMINYISLQMTEINVKETTRTVVSVQMYQIVFNLVHLLNVQFPDKEKFEIAFYSYRKMLKMAGVDLDKIIPYLKIILLENKNREDILDEENSILFDKVEFRELKESIDENIKNKNIDLYAGIESCKRINRPDPIIFEPLREEASNLLNKLTGGENEEVPEEENRNEEDEIEKKEIKINDNINEENKEPERPMEEDENNEVERPIEEDENNEVERPIEEDENKEVEKPIEEENKEIERPVEEENKDNKEPERPIEEKNKEKEKLNENNENIPKIKNEEANSENLENKNKLNNQMIINEDNKEPRREIEDLNQNEIVGQTILRGKKIDNKNKNPEKDKNKEDINKKEPYKNKEDLVKNNIINHDKDDNKKEPINEHINIIGSKKVLRNKKNVNKDKDKENPKQNENKIIEQNKPEKEKNNGIENNDNNKNKVINNNLNKQSNNDNINNMNIFRKKSKKPFKIRRTVFVKVEKGK